MILHDTKIKRVKCFGDASFTGLGAKEEVHLLVRLLMSCTERNHPPDQASAEAEKLVSSMLKWALEETVSIHRMYDNALQEHSQDVINESVTVIIRDEA